MGYFLTQRLMEAGHRLTLLNRGITPDDLPEDTRVDHTDRVLFVAVAGKGMGHISRSQYLHIRQYRITPKNHLFLRHDFVFEQSALD